MSFEHEGVGLLLNKSDMNFLFWKEWNQFLELNPSLGAWIIDSGANCYIFNKS